MRAVFLLASLALVLAFLAGCGERASTYDEKSGRYISTDDYKARYHVDSVCQRASCWDDKSGHFIGADDWNRRQRNRNRM